MLYIICFPLSFPYIYRYMSWTNFNILIEKKQRQFLFPRGCYRKPKRLTCTLNLFVQFAQRCNWNNKFFQQNGNRRSIEYIYMTGNLQCRFLVLLSVPNCVSAWGRRKKRLPFCRNGQFYVFFFTRRSQEVFPFFLHLFLAFLTYRFLKIGFEIADGCWLTNYPVIFQKSL